MAVGEVINVSSEMLKGVIADVGRLGLWMQAIGLMFILWIGFQIVSLVMNAMKRRGLKDIKNDLKRIEKKIDEMGKKK